MTPQDPDVPVVLPPVEVDREQDPETQPPDPM